MPQPKKSDAVKKGYSAGATCLGEYSLLQMNAHSSRETNTVESRKRKLCQTEPSTKLDREFGNEQHNEAVLLQEPNHHNKVALLQEPNHHNRRLYSRSQFTTELPQAQSYSKDSNEMSGLPT